MGDNYFLKLGFIPFPVLHPVYNNIMESICKYGQNQLFQFIAWD